jgi:hypothetical protein
MIESGIGFFATVWLFLFVGLVHPRGVEFDEPPEMFAYAFIGGFIGAILGMLISWL